MKPSSPVERARRGFSLVEMMVSGGLGALLLTAASATFTAQQQMQERTHRRAAIKAAAGLGMLALQRDLENVGYHFPSAALSVQSHDNLQAGAVLRGNDGADLPVVAEAGAGTGVLAGTDALDLFIGGEERRTGQVFAASGTGTNRTVLLQTLNPLTDRDRLNLASGTLGPALLFLSGTPGVDEQVACMGVVRGVSDTVSAGVPVVSVNVELVGEDLEPTPGAATCPVPGQSVFAASERHRYLVYRDASNPQAPLSGLFVQRSVSASASSGGFGRFGPPELLSEGIEDLQVRWRVLNNAPLPVPGCGTELCWCNDSDGLCAEASHQGQLRGAQVTLVSRGRELAVEAGGRRPAVFNRPEGPVDGRLRLSVSTQFNFRNFQVMP